MKDLIILGAGGAGFDIVSCVRCINHINPTWNIVGFLDDNKDLIGKRFLGVEVLGTIESSDLYPDAFFVSSIAHHQNRGIREKIYSKVKDKGGKFATIIHPSAVIYENVSIGEGCVIHANVTIGTCAKIENDVHIAYGCNLAHEVIIGNHCSFGPGVNLSSGVVIGENCYIGCGVSTTYDIEIEKNSLVTVGSSVVRSLKNKTHDCDNTWIGNPAELSYDYMRKQYYLGKLTKDSN